MYCDFKKQIHNQILLIDHMCNLSDSMCDLNVSMCGLVFFSHWALCVAGWPTVVSKSLNVSPQDMFFKFHISRQHINFSTTQLKTHTPLQQPVLWLSDFRKSRTRQKDGLSLTQGTKRSNTHTVNKYWGALPQTQIWYWTVHSACTVTWLTVSKVLKMHWRTNVG